MLSSNRDQTVHAEEKGEACFRHVERKWLDCRGSSPTHTCMQTAYYHHGTSRVTRNAFVSSHRAEPSQKEVESTTGDSPTLRLQGLHSRADRRVRANGSKRAVGGNDRLCRDLRNRSPTRELEGAAGRSSVVVRIAPDPTDGPSGVEQALIAPRPGLTARVRLREVEIVACRDRAFQREGSDTVGTCTRERVRARGLVGRGWVETDGDVHWAVLAGDVLSVKIVSLPVRASN